MNNTLQLYVDDEKTIKGYPVTSPDRVIDENGKSVKDKLKNNVKFDVVGQGVGAPPIDGGNAELVEKVDKLEELVDGISNSYKKSKLINVSDIGLKIGDIDNSAILNKFINSVSQEGCTLLFTNGFYTFKNNIEIPHYIDLMFIKGAGVNVNQGTTIKINGNIIAGNFLLFRGNGMIDLNTVSSKINIGWFEGESLNKKWDKIRKSFISWSQYDLIIPKPHPNQQGAMYYQESQKSRWVWKLDDTFIFDDKCNCGTIWSYSEICPVGTIDIGMLFDDEEKVENIKFPIGLSLVGCESKNNYFKTAIEIRGIARLHIQGKLDIQYCDTGILFGGKQQTREIGQCIFENTHIAFSGLNAIRFEGHSREILNVYFGDLVIEANKNPDMDNILIIGKVLDVYFRNIYTQTIRPNTNVPTSVVTIKPNVYGVSKNITIDNMWVAQVSTYAIRTIQGENTSSMSEEIKLGFIHVDIGKSLNFNYVKHVIVYKGITPTAPIEICNNAQFVNLNLGNRLPVINDNGIGTIINNMGQKAFSSGNYPDVNLFGKGNMIYNSYDNSVWVRIKNTGNGVDDFIKISN